MSKARKINTRKEKYKEHEGSNRIHRHVIKQHAQESNIVGKMASYVTFQYNILVVDIDNTTLGLMRLFR